MVVMRLYLCEKPSQAKDIAKVLGANRRGDGCWVGTGVTVTWCIGHLLETAPPDAYDAKYKRWVLADLPIVPEKWKMLVKPKTATEAAGIATRKNHHQRNGDNTARHVYRHETSPSACSARGRKTVKLEAFQRPRGWSIPAATTKIDWVAGNLRQISTGPQPQACGPAPASPLAIAGLAKSWRAHWRKRANLTIRNAIDLTAASAPTF